MNLQKFATIGIFIIQVWLLGVTYPGNHRRAVQNITVQQDW